MNTERQISTKRSKSFRRFILTIALTVASVSTVIFGATHRTMAGDRRKVCWDKVYVRNFPQRWAWNQLYKGQTFEVYEYRASGWARGFAYGHINTDKSPREIGQPYRKEYADVWIQVAALCK